MAKQSIGSRIANSRFGRFVRRTANRVSNAITGRQNLQLGGRAGHRRINFDGSIGSAG